jgi:type IV secretory pathway VirD2 relaxase
LFCGSGGGDIVKAINRTLKARGEERALESYSFHSEEATARIVGRVIDKRLTDELGERLGLVIDGVDGRARRAGDGDGRRGSADRINC